MYELTCPFCRNVVATSFVRKGAMATCPQCSRAYLIKTETYRRLVSPETGERLEASNGELGVAGVPMGGATGRVEPGPGANGPSGGNLGGGAGSGGLTSAAPSPAASPQASPAPTSRHGAASSSRGSGGVAGVALGSTAAESSAGTAASSSAGAIGGSGASASSAGGSGGTAGGSVGSGAAGAIPVVRATLIAAPDREAARPSPSPIVADPTGPAPPPPDPAVVRALARHARRRRSNPAAAWLVLFLLLGVAVVTAILTWNQLGHNAVRSRTPGSADSPEDANAVTDPEHVSPAPLDSQIPVVTSEPLPLAGTWAKADAPADLNPPQGPIRVDPYKITRGRDQAYIYESQVVSQSFDLIESATVRLSLVEEKDHVYAQMTLPMALLSGQRPRPLRLEIPAALHDRLVRVDWSVDAGAPLKGGVFFDQALVEPMTAPKGLAVKITAYNPLSKPLQRAVFLVTAKGQQDQPVGQWLIVWAQPIGARQRVDLQALVNTDKARAPRAWEVTGAASTESAP